MRTRGAMRAPSPSSQCGPAATAKSARFELPLRDHTQLLLQDAARAAVREAAVDAGTGRIRDAARRSLAGVKVEVHRAGGVGDPVEVRVSYHDRTNVPLVGPLFPDVTLRARATMREELA